MMTTSFFKPYTSVQKTLMSSCAVCIERTPRGALICA